MIFILLVGHELCLVEYYNYLSNPNLGYEFTAFNI